MTSPTGHVSGRVYCGCDKCRRNRKRNLEQRRLRELRGQSTWTDRATVIAHIQKLKAVGYTLNDIADRGGWTDGIRISHLIRNPSPRILTSTAVRIYAIPATPQRQGRGYVSAKGTMRRLQALARIGYDTETIRAATGISRRTITYVRSGDYKRVTVNTAEKIRQFYLTADNIGPSTRTAQWAARNRWLPPAAWDDDTIDTANPTIAYQTVNWRKKDWTP